MRYKINALPVNGYTLHFLRNRELNELYASMAIRAFAMAMISIFVPIFLLELGYSLSSVLVYYAILNGAHALFVFPAAKISSRYGFKHAMFFSILILLIFYAFLNTLEANAWPLWWLAIIFGASNALFWMGYHSDFSKISTKSKRGQQVGFSNVFAFAGSIVGPLFGGLIVTFTNFQVLFTVVSFVLLASAIPLFMSKDKHEPIRMAFPRIFSGRSIRSSIAFMGHGIESSAGSILWPIYIFGAVLKSFSVLGIITSLSYLFALVSTLIIGKISDIRRRLVLVTGSFLNAIVWGVRVLITTPLQVFIVDSLYGLTKSMRVVPMDALSYDEARRTSILESMVFREVFIAVGSVILFLSLLLIADLTASFIFGAGASFLFLLF